MRLLIDNALSPHLASILRADGEDAVHIRERIPHDSPDEVVFDLAAAEQRILISADSDFGTILAHRRASRPSLILLRHDAPALPEFQAPLIHRILRAAESELLAGCVVSATKDRLRLRMLPFG